MSDKLQWLNRHMLLLNHNSVDEVVQFEQYPLSQQLKTLAQQAPQSIDYIDSLCQKDNYQEACKFIGYNLHKRVAVWWAYVCVLDLLAELKRNPHQERSLDDIAKPAPFKIPQWAQEPPQTPSKPDPQIIAQAQAQVEQMQEIKKMFSPQAIALGEELMAMINQPFIEKFGKSPLDRLYEIFDYVKEHGVQSSSPVDIENSPITKAANKLKEQIEKMRLETIDKIKAALGPDLSEDIAQAKGSALDAVYAYITAPNESNAALCLELGNKIPDKPEGLLALCAFWSFGNLTPQDDEQVVKTPAGLLGNGLNSLLLMLALQAGGDRNFKQRYKAYFEYAYAATIGASNWTQSLEQQYKPHQRMAEFLQEQQQLADIQAPQSQSNQLNETQARPVVERFKLDD